MTHSFGSLQQPPPGGCHLLPRGRGRGIPGARHPWQLASRSSQTCRFLGTGHSFMPQLISNVPPLLLLLVVTLPFHLTFSWFGLLAGSQVDALSRPFPCLCHCPWVWFAFLSFELSGIGEEEGRRPFNPLGHLVDTKVDYRRKKTRERPNCSKERADEEGKNERTVGKSTKKTSTREQKRPKKVQQTRLPGTGSRHTAKVSS